MGIAAMEEPFGRELDDLRPDNIIISTERTIFNFLVAPSITAPDSEQSDHGSSRDDELAKCKVQLEALRSNFNEVQRKLEIEMRDRKAEQAAQHPAPSETLREARHEATHAIVYDHINPGPVY